MAFRCVRQAFLGFGRPPTQIRGYSQQYEFSRDVVNDFKVPKWAKDVRFFGTGWMLALPPYIIWDTLELEKCRDPNYLGPEAGSPKSK